MDFIVQETNGDDKVVDFERAVKIKCNDPTKKVTCTTQAGINLEMKTMSKDEILLWKLQLKKEKKTLWDKRQDVEEYTSVNVLSPKDVKAAIKEFIDDINISTEDIELAHINKKAIRIFGKELIE